MKTIEGAKYPARTGIFFGIGRLPTAMAPALLPRRAGRQDRRLEPLLRRLVAGRITRHVPVGMHTLGIAAAVVAWPEWTAGMIVLPEQLHAVELQDHARLALHV